MRIKSLHGIVTIIAMISVVALGDRFTGADPDSDLWNAAANWSTNEIPQSNDWCEMTVDGTRCVIDASHVGDDSAKGRGVYVGCYGGDNEMYMTGGELTCQYFNIGRGDAGSQSDGFFRMTDGLIHAISEVMIPNQFNSGQGNISGQVDLWGGTIITDGFFLIGSRVSGASHGGVGKMDVRAGTLIVNGDSFDRIQGYINAGWITAYDGDGEFDLDYNERNAGKTTLTAFMQGIAGNLEPLDEQEQVEADVALRWTAGKNAISHNVRFDTSNPPAFVVNQPLAQCSYAPELLPETTYYWRIDEVGDEGITEGETWSFTTEATAGEAKNLSPLNGSEDRISGKVFWSAGDNANSHNVYFGKTNPPAFIGNQSLDQTSYESEALDPGATYYWRIDEVNSFGSTEGQVWSFHVAQLPLGDLNADRIVDLFDLQQLLANWLDIHCLEPLWCDGADMSEDGKVNNSDFAILSSEIMAYETVQPPYTDYNAMLSQEIQDKKHGFMAGNLTYYIGGKYNTWDKAEDETLGLTHPFYHDLRSRGTGMVQDGDTGYGHDMAGGSWDFYQFTKVAYGTVIVDGTEYPNPVPEKMYWQPDKMICEYSVGGVNIREEKFIAENDAACTIITSDTPVTLKFNGQSFWSRNNSVTSTASCTYVQNDNCIRIAEGGTVTVKPNDPGPLSVGKMVYDGMTTVLTSDRPMTEYIASSDANNQWFYEFKVSCDSQGTAIVWSMHDEQSVAVANAMDIVGDPAGQKQAKSDEMNDKLNYEIPYFRCSDQDIVDVYYYLWAINLMYYIDVDKGWEQYPHTQSAVNNFMGMHRYDAVFQIRVGAWAADKEKYANGNALVWSALLPTAKHPGMVADNMGIGWHSGIYGPEVIAHVPQAWLIYEHSGDLEFLARAYAFYKPLFWNGAAGHWGYIFEAGESLCKMAETLGYPEDGSHWRSKMGLDNVQNWLNARWDAEKHIFLPQTPQGWTSFAYMAMDEFPDEWAKEMTEHWALDSVDGFFTEVPLAVRALKDWDTLHGVDNVFVVTPDTNWYATRGMYKHHVGQAANTCALGHLKNYNMYWGIPIAPESFDINFEPWGDQYSNFNTGKILLILEGMSGISYSIVDDEFEVADCMPLEWDFMEFYIPVNKDGQTNWTRVRTDRNSDGSSVEKTVTVEGNKLQKLKIQPWLDEKTLLSAPAGYIDQTPIGHIGYSFEGTEDETIVIYLQK
ncbi:MAG: hypothetical protein JEZ07_07420 [Phycisphaerae bacterium]|nr:hypothetical protein [Phycisphaerae bacterium]